MPLHETWLYHGHVHWWLFDILSSKLTSKKIKAMLGIWIIQDTSNHTISMMQPGLIDYILNTKFTPSDAILYPDVSGQPRQDTWHYRSIIGKLNFLAQNTRPDISYRTSMCMFYQQS